MSDQDVCSQGKVYLVGAGPGDPGLITLRGAETLRAADVVLYDYLVNPVLGRHARSDAELICLGKHGRTRIWTQDEVNAKVLKYVLAGKTVVRLKSGDPSIFARAGEEVGFLRAHDIDFETVPGITAAMAVGSYAGVPLTHRDYASAVAFITGRESSQANQRLDYAALAKFPGTIVIYMGVTTASEWSGKLLANGLEPTTPVLLVRRCSYPDQETKRCTLAEVESLLTPYQKFPPPALVIIGEAARAADAGTWFDSRPLFGQTVLVTRALDQADELTRQLEVAGAEVLLQPAIKVLAAEASDQIADTCNRLHEFGWITFTSPNGVRYFFHHLNMLGFDSRALAGCKLAAVGESTSVALAEFGLLADLVPERANANELALELIPQLKNCRCLLIQGERSRGILEKELGDAAVPFEALVVYRAEDIVLADESVRCRMNSAEIDWTIVTSPAVAANVVAQFGDGLRHSKVLTISPLTSQAVEKLGHQASLESNQPSVASIVETLIEAVSGSK